VTRTAGQNQFDAFQASERCWTQNWCLLHHSRI